MATIKHREPQCFDQNTQYDNLVGFLEVQPHHDVRSHALQSQAYYNIQCPVMKLYDVVPMQLVDNYRNNKLKLDRTDHTYKIVYHAN